MEKINLSIYCTTFGQTKEGQITDIRTEKRFQGVVDSITTINLKVAEIAVESLELITHGDWTLTAKDTNELYYGQDLLTYQYDLKASSSGGINHKVIYYAVLEEMDTNEIDTSTTKPPKNVMPRTID